MKFICLLFSFANFYPFVNSDKIIKNINLPSCRNCVYYKPYALDLDYTSTLGKCEKFGEKNFITDEIKYNEYADLCRNDDSKCGKKGKYFEEEKNVNMKILKHRFTIPFQISIIIMIIIILPTLVNA